MFRIFGWLCFAGVFALSCANIKQLPGGQADIIAPKIDTAKCKNLFATNFSGKEPIVVHFDEWVRFLNPTKNIIVSPPTKLPVQYKLKGKRLLISFDKNEVLEPQTTYSINLGEAVRDITAQNIARNINVVFSTGPSIDSGEIRGKIFDAQTNKFLAKIPVTLYKNQEDSAFTKTKPFYVTYSDTAGSFHFKYLKDTVYKLYAIQDKNQNYFYDQKIESIGYYEGNARPFQSATEYIIFLSQEKLPLKIKNKVIKPGLLAFAFTQDIEKEKTQISPKDKFVKTIFYEDSILYYYNSAEEFNAYFELEAIKDTVKLNKYTEPDSVQMEKLVLVKEAISQIDSAQIQSPSPIFSLDESKIRSTPEIKFLAKINLRNPQIIDIVYQETKPIYFTIILDSMAVRMQGNRTNRTDTFHLKTKVDESLSRLELILDSLQTGQQYILNFSYKDKPVLQKIFVAEKTMETFRFTHLDPLVYEVKLIVDRNQNGKWDPIDFKEKQQAERIFGWKLKELRADWDQKMILNVGE